MRLHNSKSLRTGRYGLLQNSEDVNPMTYISNIADAMLVLAMGIMVALVLHWNVDLNETSDTITDEQNPVVTINQDELESQEKLPENAARSGEVYYDSETGTYYIVRDGSVLQTESDGTSSGSDQDN